MSHFGVIFQQCKLLQSCFNQQCNVNVLVFLWKSSFLFIARRFSLLFLCLFQLAFDCTSLWQVPGAKTSSFLVVFFHLILISSFLLCSFPTIWSDFIHRHSLHTNSVRPSISSENNSELKKASFLHHQGIYLHTFIFLAQN